MKKKVKQKLLYLCIVIIATLIICGAEQLGLISYDENQDFFEINEVSQDGLFEVQYIDVGQGDAILIRTPDNKSMLIDAGENENEEFMVEYLKNQGIETLDFVMATHPHSDHIGGMDAVIENFEINTFYMPNVHHETKTFENMLDALERSQAKIEIAKKGIKFNMGQYVVGEIYSPVDEEYEDLNNYSPITKITYGETNFLFTGDAEKFVEEQILSENLASDVIKAGHHGSSSSSSPDFIKQVNPAYAIISCAKDNKYGHPHVETVSLYNDLGIDFIRTDESGTVIVFSDGEKLTILSEKEGVLVDERNH